MRRPYAAALAQLKQEGRCPPHTLHIRGEARMVERAFGLGASALAEAAQLLNQQLQLKAA